MRRTFIGVDVGGTFTDLVSFDSTSGELTLAKVPSTPPDFSQGVIAAVREALQSDAGPAHVARFAHGTTVGTNAVLEGKGARVGLLTTEGFRDVLEIGRQDRDDIYDILYERPQPLVPRDRRIGVRERMLASGDVLTGLDEQAAAAAVRRLVAEGVEAIAICLLNAHANPVHERLLERIVKSVAPAVPVSVSSEVLPEFREYERTATTVMNAYVMPVTGKYLARLSNVITDEGITATLGVMQSNGGLLPITAAARHAVGALLSGPAAGVVGAVAVAQASGFSDVISFDMGGTSCDVSLVAGGTPRVSVGARLSGHPVQLPMLDIHTVGAGGGSIARVQGAALKVGPESAGANPGPVCYGRGGTQPTVSDAHAALGRLSTRRFLGGKNPLDVRAAIAAIDRQVASPLGISVERAALGILAVADDRMMHAIRSVSVERGYDPRGAALVAFGGAGPLHASSAARLLKIRTVLVPPTPGALSALGLLLAETRRDLVKTWLRPIADVRCADLESAYRDLADDGRRQLEAEGIESEQIWTTRTADMRYRGQAFELMVSVPEPLDDAALSAVLDAFHAAHQRAYGHSSASAAVELVNLRVQTWGRVPKPMFREVTVSERRPVSAAVIERRPVGVDLERLEDVPVLDRDLLQPGHAFQGPAIIEQKDATTVLLRGDELEVDRFGSLIVRVGTTA